MARPDSFNLMKLGNQLATEADAYTFMEHLRWGDSTPPCPHCGDTERAFFLNPTNGVSRKTRTGAASQRRVWKCGACRRQFSVTTGTIFHGSKIPLRTWVMVVFEMCASKNGVSAREIERKYGLTAKSAWFMLHRIREGMKREPLVGMLRGVVVADETFIGGKPKNRHKNRRPYRQTPEPTPYLPSDKPPYSSLVDKTPVLSLIDRDTGEVRSRVIPDVTGATLRKTISEQVDMAATTLHTDEGKGYRPFEHEFAAHETVNHSEDEYVRYEGDRIITTNHAEGYFSQLKRSIDGTHHHVSREHLPRYLAEFDYRYSTRKLSDTARMRRLMGQVEGRRLTYRPLTGESGA